MDTKSETVSNPPHRPIEDGVWPAGRRRILDWLVGETRSERFLDNILVEMCGKLGQEGVPVARSTLHLRVDNPQWQGARMLWKRGMSEAEFRTFDYGIEETPQYLNSPIYEINSGAPEVRRRLDKAATGGYPLYEELAAEGYTDYVAWPIDHTLGKRHVVTFSTDVAEGFAADHLAYLRDLLPAFALVSEIRIKNRLARTLLDTYVGTHASEAILAGATTRGSGMTVGAAILICDLRDFTAISDAWPRDDVIGLLNEYFDAMCEPMTAHGGEILKLMGDGFLAIFPLNQPRACANLLTAIDEAQAGMRALNARHVSDGRPTLGYGIGVHVGDVMYGNIGSRKRLDFTVIGPAVNLASRIESLTKTVRRPVLFSLAFAEMAGRVADMESLGAFQVKGLSEPIEVLTFPQEA